VRLAVGAFIAANTMTASLAFNLSEVTPRARLAGHLLILAATLVTVVLLGWPLLRAAGRELRAGRLTLEAMFLLGIGGALGASLLATLRGEGAVYYEIVSILLVVYSLGQMVAGVAQQRALAAAAAWAPAAVTCQVETAGGTYRTVAVAEVQPGDVVLVPPGAAIPVDGEVVAGEAFVREAELTGEPLAVVRRVGDRVFAGTHCLDATLKVRATAPGTARRLDAIVGAVEQARALPTRLERAADRAIRWLLPAVVVVAVGTLVAWSHLASWDVGLFNAMAVLLVACPCALGLATPLAVWVALGRMAARGVVVRAGEVVERLAGVDTAVLDKTGTLTEATATLVDLVVEGDTGAARGRALALLAAVERASGHPLASAFGGGEAGSSTGMVVISARLLPAVGVEARVRVAAAAQELLVRVGRPEVLVDQGQGGVLANLRGRLRGEGREVALLVDGHLVALARLAERLRASWPAALAQFARLGVRTVVMTGDGAARARLVAADEVLAALSPEEKLQRVRALQSAGRRVLFVGDGVNDAAAMAAAHVSIAVAGGAELAVEVGAASWSGGDLTALPAALEQARATVQLIRSNLAFAAAYNLAGVGLAAAGLLHPVTAALLMTCSSLMVTWRAAGREWEDSPQGEERSAPGLTPAGEVA
jgi:heavy metal translocating P-type ATPase